MILVIAGALLTLALIQALMAQGLHNHWGPRVVLGLAGGSFALSIFVMQDYLLSGMIPAPGTSAYFYLALGYGVGLGLALVAAVGVLLTGGLALSRQEDINPPSSVRTLAWVSSGLSLFFVFPFTVLNPEIYKVFN